MKTLLLLLLIPATAFAQNGRGTYSPAAYRDAELRTKAAAYTKTVRAVVAYEVANMKKFMKGEVTKNWRGYTYTFTNTAQYAELLQCDFVVSYKDAAGHVLATSTGTAGPIPAGTSSKPVAVPFTTPAGTASITMVVRHLVAE